MLCREKGKASRPAAFWIALLLLIGPSLGSRASKPPARVQMGSVSFRVPKGFQVTKRDSSPRDLGSDSTRLYVVHLGSKRAPLVAAVAMFAGLSSSARARELGDWKKLKAKWKLLEATTENGRQVRTYSFLHRGSKGEVRGLAILGKGDEWVLEVTSSIDQPNGRPEWRRDVDLAFKEIRRSVSDVDR